MNLWLYFIYDIQRQIFHSVTDVFLEPGLDVLLEAYSKNDPNRYIPVLLSRLYINFSSAAVERVQIKEEFRC